ncbi:MAG: hypothetical protein HY785_09420 [Oscillatoriophycideae cyanobacterium NC_groundwater_1537_Pr4_S-0.65um_50_18]|nr:hypothetical protein [Oscillatoriophycideae cyanobacterium NC_groundwater_1537_Pr4_S-0.65um_50_18]
MAESLSLWVEQTLPFRQVNPWIDLAEAVDLAGGTPSASSQVQDRDRGVTCNATCIRLDMENLNCFESVERQFEAWGVVFANAIALRPSNPGYPAYSGSMVLMSAPKNGYLEITFLRPASFVSGFITSSRRAVLTAFDADNQAIASTETAGANLLQDTADSESRHAPNAQLILRAANIHRVTLHAFDGQLTLDDFCFCLEGGN